jgi:hypothetical protein
MTDKRLSVCFYSCGNPKALQAACRRVYRVVPGIPVIDDLLPQPCTRSARTGRQAYSSPVSAMIDRGSRMAAEKSRAGSPLMRCLPGHQHRCTPPYGPLLPLFIYKCAYDVASLVFGPKNECPPFAVVAGNATSPTRLSVSPASQNCRCPAPGPRWRSH